MDKEIKIIADHYGYEPQSRQLIEEMAELTVALNKLWRFEQLIRNKNLDELPIEEMITLTAKESECLKQIYSEIADVDIMLTQIKHLLGCQEEVDTVKRQKVLRQLTRIQGEVDKHE